MKAANITTSERLQRVAQFLTDGRERSTMEIIRECNVCAVNSIIAELRDNGLPVHCRREGDTWYYRREASE
jgi:hypothetical protein